MYIVTVLIPLHIFDDMLMSRIHMLIDPNVYVVSKFKWKTDKEFIWNFDIDFLDFHKITLICFYC